MGRSVLRRQLIESWHECIGHDYVRQRINSERSLQASLWAALRNRLDPNTRRMFIEPCLSTARMGSRAPEQEKRYPDLVVCNTRSVIAIIEIKFQPRANARWSKDLESLNWIARNREHMTIQNARHRGVEADGRPYPISPSALLVWAGVHATEGLWLRKLLPPELNSNFLELHAVTRQGNTPSVSPALRESRTA